MPKVKLRVNRWLCRSLNIEPTDSSEIFISVPEGESLSEMVSRLAAEDSIFWRALLDEKSQGIGANILVILNGRIVNPYDRSETLLKEGDELTFLPAFDGG